jgi:hypothetical protein
MAAPKSTHDHPLTWANKKLTHKPITLSIQPTFDSPTPIHAQKVFPQCFYKTNPTKIHHNTTYHNHLKPLEKSCTPPHDQIQYLAPLGGCMVGWTNFGITQSIFLLPNVILISILFCTLWNC